MCPNCRAFISAADSVCPYCGVGCQLTYHVKDNRILFVEGRDGPSNHGRLCVKGRYGFDYVAHPQRLTKPLIRKPGIAKSADFTMDPSNPLEVFREATWEEALDLADRIVVMREGRIVAQGIPPETLTSAALGEVYGIEIEMARLPGGQTVCVPKLERR